MSTTQTVHHSNNHFDSNVYEEDLSDVSLEDSDFSDSSGLEQDPVTQDSHQTRTELNRLQQKNNRPQLSEEDWNFIDEGLSSSGSEEEDPSIEWVQTFSDDLAQFKQDLSDLKGERKIKDEDAKKYAGLADQALGKLKKKQFTIEQAQGELKNIKTQLSEASKKLENDRKQERKDKIQKAIQAMDLMGAKIKDFHYSNPCSFSRSTDNGWNGLCSWGLGILTGGLTQIIGEAVQQDESSKWLQKGKDLAQAIKNTLTDELNEDTTGRKADWSTVENLIKSIDDSHVNDLMQFVVGAIHQAGGENEEETIKILNVLPEGLRKVMAEKCVKKADEANNKSRLDHPSENITYWDPTGTSQIITKSIAGKDQYFYLNDDASKGNEPDPETLGNQDSEEAGAAA
ncbi:MAG: hypothetical protein U1F57_00050 [bacterium]